MAIGRCDKCSSRLKLGSPVCPRCGTKKQRVKYLLIAIIFAECAVIGQHLAWPDQGGLVHVAEAQESAVPVFAGTDAPAGWMYYQTVDEMIYDTTHHARVLSHGVPANDGPNEHASAGVLELRASPAYGRSVVVTLTRQPAETVGELCELRARFDAGEEAVFQAQGSADPHRATLVVADTGGFVRRLMAAHTLDLKATLSPKAVRVAMFDVTGLKWQ